MRSFLSLHSYWSMGNDDRIFPHIGYKHHSVWFCEALWFHSEGTMMITQMSPSVSWTPYCQRISPPQSFRESPCMTPLWSLYKLYSASYLLPFFDVFCVPSILLALMYPHSIISFEAIDWFANDSVLSRPFLNNVPDSSFLTNPGSLKVAMVKNTWSKSHKELMLRKM